MKISVSFKKIFLIIVTLFTINLYAQMSDSLIKYYYHVNKAELNIVDSLYTEALSNYKKAFSFFKTPFSKDLINVSNCCVRTKNYKKCYVFVSILTKRGISINYFQKRKDYFDFFNSKEGKQLVTECGNISYSYNPLYRYKIDSLCYQDQHFRKKEGSYSLYLDTITKIDKSNVECLNKLISVWGFPSESKIGVSEKSLSAPVYDIIIIHQRSASLTRNFDFTAMLQDAAEKGEIEAHQAAELIDQSSGKNIYGTTSFGLYKMALDSNLINSYKGYKNRSDKWGYIPLKPEDEAIINESRKKIGLESHGEILKKVIHGLTSSDLLISGSTNFTIYNWGNITDYEKAIKNLIYLK
ncbi:MAG: hypothetical protein IT239_00525 [Bacteroidia bacterium]|nr:hypothetical protein [Bacteroidia bacterium]